MNLISFPTGSSVIIAVILVLAAVALILGLTFFYLRKKRTGRSFMAFPFTHRHGKEDRSLLHSSPDLVSKDFSMLPSFFFLLERSLYCPVTTRSCFIQREGQGINPALLLHVRDLVLK